jgi:hypothetical protein
MEHQQHQQQQQPLGATSVGDAIARPYDVITRVFEAHATADIAAPVSAEFTRLLDLGAGDRSPHLAQVLFVWLGPLPPFSRMLCLNCHHCRVSKCVVS